MTLIKNDSYLKYERKFFKKHKNLISKYSKVLKQLEENPFNPSLNTHKLKGKLKDFYSCSLDYEHRIILSIIIMDEKVYLIDIGNHNEVY